MKIRSLKYCWVLLFMILGTANVQAQLKEAVKNILLGDSMNVEPISQKKIRIPFYW